MDTYLEAKGLEKSYQKKKVVRNVSIKVRRGEIVGLLGPNGAGKTTTFGMILGHIPQDAGKIYLDGEDITGKRPNVIVNKGLARTFQTVKLLEGKSVLETMMTAFFLTYEYNVLDAIFQTRRYKKQEKALEEKAIHFLTKLGVHHLKDEISNELPYGFQRKVSIAGMLCLNPKVLLLDEPMAGLTHSEKNELIDMILGLKEEFHLSIILVEHDMKVIMNLCDSIAVMNNGLLIAEGNSEEIRADQNVIKAYLGKNAA